jgi:hypothetical protein
LGPKHVASYSAVSEFVKETINDGIKLDIIGRPEKGEKSKTFICSAMN